MVKIKQNNTSYSSYIINMQNYYDENDKSKNQKTKPLTQTLIVR